MPRRPATDAWDGPAGSERILGCPGDGQVMGHAQRRQDSSYARGNPENVDLRRLTLLVSGQRGSIWMVEK